MDKRTRRGCGEVFKNRSTSSASHVKPPSPCSHQERISYYPPTLSPRSSHSTPQRTSSLGMPYNTTDTYDEATIESCSVGTWYHTVLMGCLANIDWYARFILTGFSDRWTVREIRHYKQIIPDESTTGSIGFLSVQWQHEYIVVELVKGVLGSESNKPLRRLLQLERIPTDRVPRDPDNSTKKSVLKTKLLSLPPFIRRPLLRFLSPILLYRQKKSFSKTSNNHQYRHTGQSDHSKKAQSEG